LHVTGQHRNREKPLILVVEDEEHVASFVQQALQEAGYDVLVAADAETGEHFWVGHDPDLLILDLMLPDRDGIELLDSPQRALSKTPVLILSARSAMSDRVKGLDAGADDYLGKPFGVEELLARVRVLLRRAKDSQPTVHKCDDLQIDVLSRRVTRGERLIFLSETEYRLLELLAQRRETPVSKRELLAHVWDDPDRDDNVVEVYVSYVRNKLEWRGAKRLVHTVRGKGYMLSETGDAS